MRGIILDRHPWGSHFITIDNSSEDDQQVLNRLIEELVEQINKISKLLETP